LAYFFLKNKFSFFKDFKFDDPIINEILYNNFKRSKIKNNNLNFDEDIDINSVLFNLLKKIDNEKKVNYNYNS
jgi:hypothetical protein